MMIFMIFFSLLFLLLHFSFSLRTPSNTLLTLIDATTANQLPVALESLSSLQLHDLPVTLVDRFNRLNVGMGQTMVAASSEYDLQLHCSIIPSGQTSPLHSRPGTIFVKAVQGNTHICTALPLFLISIHTLILRLILIHACKYRSTATTRLSN